MKGIYITFIFSVVFTLSLIAQKNTFYVVQGATGQGTNWTDASGDLNAVLSFAQAGDRIFVAKGTYLPTTDYNREIAFSIPTGVQVYGGFVGNETEISQRDFTTNTTILSGQLQDNKPAENSYNVVVFKNADTQTVLDGFVIENGNANGFGKTAARKSCGGGVYNDGSGSTNKSNPNIANCTFRNNLGRDGAAVYNNGIAGEASPTFTNCTFEFNQAERDGGAVFNDGRKEGLSSPVFYHCTMLQNSADYGGGVCNYAGGGQSSPIFNDCLFENNSAKVRGGGMYNMDVAGVCVPVVKNCSFTSNDASTGASKVSLEQVKPSIETKNLAVED